MRQEFAGRFPIRKGGGLPNGLDQTGAADGLVLGDERQPMCQGSRTDQASAGSWGNTSGKSTAKAAISAVRGTIPGTAGGRGETALPPSRDGCNVAPPWAAPHSVEPDRDCSARRID